MPERAGGARKPDQVRSALLDLIESLPDGAPLPPERQLAQDLGVARMTLRRAVDLLVTSGELTRMPGRGTFVVKDGFISPSGRTSFHEEIERHGMRPGSRTVEFERKAAGARIAQRLAISPEDEVLRAVRVRLADDEPVALERIHVPADLVPGLTRDDLDTGSFYDLLLRRYGIAVGGSARVVQATVVDAGEADLLQVPLHAPAFYIQSTRHSRQGRVVEFLDAIYRGDRYRFVSGDLPGDLDTTPSLVVNSLASLRGVLG